MVRLFQYAHAEFIAIRYPINSFKKLSEWNARTLSASCCSCRHFQTDTEIVNSKDILLIDSSWQYLTVR